MKPSNLILVEPTHPILNTSADEATLDELSSNSVQGVIDRMLEIAAGKGHSKHDSRQMVGLAAVQLGIPKRIILIDTTADGSNKQQHLQIIINPRIIKASEETVPGREGCWSCSNICGNVERAKSVTLEGLDRTGKSIKLELTNFVARIAQHEVDHLHGIRFPDRIPVDEPQRLHWVEPTEFEEYRQNWMHWEKLCQHETWEAMKQATKTVDIGLLGTRLLYMQDFDVETCEATIVSAIPTDDERLDLILDQTSFYARGGGQDWDKGIIRKPSAEFAVEEVHLDENGIVHHIGTASGAFAEDDKITCEVDHERRVINMRLHSAAHVIDMAVDKLGLDWVATKGQHYPHLSAVEYSGTWKSEEAENLRAVIETLTNKLIEEGSHNTLRFMPVEEMRKYCRNVPDNLPRNKPGRVVFYGDFGVPCGGTHVRDIKQIGKIAIPKMKEKKGVIRVNYTVESVIE